MSIRTFVNKESTVLVQVMTIGDGETIHVATRDHPDAIWGPRIVMVEKERS